MSEDLLAKYYQKKKQKQNKNKKNKEILKKKVHNRYQDLSEKEKKSDNIVGKNCCTNKG